MLSKKSKYALKALVALAKEYERGPILISQIAEAERIPKKFLEAILLGLRKTGILGSKMGAGGGYYMIKSPSEVMISNVIRLTDGPIALVPCASLNFYEACGECADEATCSVRSIAKEVRDVSLNILSNTSIADLINREQQLKKTAHKSDRKKGRKK